MSRRVILGVLAVLVLVGVVVFRTYDGGTSDTADEASASEAAEPAMDDTAAVEAVTQEWVAHYNMHHPSVVAGYHIDDTVTLLADGSVNRGLEAVTASLEANMANSPTLTVDAADTIVTGDWAVQRGSYSAELEPEGADAMSLTGNFLTTFQRVDGEWKVAYVITNYDTVPPAGVQFAPDSGEVPEELADSVLGDLNDYLATHFNMGHGQMVADNAYTEDAVAALANQPLAEGREAIATLLQAEIDASSPQLTIHPVGEVDLGGGYVLGGGWYELAVDNGNTTGSYMVLARQQDDGGYKYQWAVTNGKPAN